MLVRGIRFLHGWYRRSKKIVRSFFYFGKPDVYVHGPIFVGKRRNVKIGKHCSVNRGVIIQAFNDTRIGSGVVLSVNCMLLDGNLDHEGMVENGKRGHIPSYVHIGDQAWIGAGAILLPGVTVGPRSIVAAGSVVSGTFPEGVLIAGNPARVIRKLAYGEPLRRPSQGGGA